MKPIFTAEDFSDLDSNYSVGDQCADIANAKLEKLLGPVVYHSNRYAHKVWDEVPCGPGQMGCTDTHTARLFNVQPIERAESCDHQPEFTNKIPGWHHGPDSKVQCAKCGAKLRAKWEVAE